MDTMLTDYTRSGYADPVARLLTFGNPVGDDPAEWTDYTAQFGFGAEHVDELIRMACDEALNLGDTDSDEVWAPVHAMRALGQLRAEAAVAPLLALIETEAGQFMPEMGLADVFGMIGPPAIPPVAAFILDAPKATSPGIAAVSCLKEVALRHPQYRAECIEILEQRLLLPDPVDKTINGFAVGALLDLAAVGSIDVMREAFRRDAVDLAIAGDLEDAEIELGLRQHRVTRKPRYVSFVSDWGPPDEIDAFALPQPQQPVRREKVGRNQPCPCGSGKKYKKCCLNG